MAQWLRMLIAVTQRTPTLSISQTPVVLVPRDPRITYAIFWLQCAPTQTHAQTQIKIIFFPLKQALVLEHRLTSNS